jgi:hypothetical protein
VTTRSRSIVLAVLFILLATLAPATAAPPDRNPSDLWHFTWNGKQWYPTGYTPGLLAVMGVNDWSIDPTGTYYKTILNDMAASNVRLIRQVFYFGQPAYEGTGCSPASITRTALTYYKRTGGGTAEDGKQRFNLTDIDANYVKHFKNFVDYASQKGIVVVVDVFDSWHLNKDVATTNCSGPRGRNYDAYYTTNNSNGVSAVSEGDFHPESKTSAVYLKQKALVRDLVQQIGSYDNIIWSVANEVEHIFPIPASPASSTTDFTIWTKNMAQEIYDAETFYSKPHHLIMQKDLPDHLKAGGNQNNLLTSPNVHQEFIDKYNLNWQMPLICDNDGATIVLSANGKRRKAWASLTAGGHMTYFPYATAVLSEWQKQEHVDARNYLGYVTKFVDSARVNLAGLVNRDDLISGTGNPAAGWLAARVTPGSSEYVAYMDPKTCTGSTSCVPEEEGGLWPGVTQYTITSLPSSFTWTWYNPRTGLFNPSLSGTGPSVTFTTPTAGNDWVLYIREGLAPTASVPSPETQQIASNQTAQFSVVALGPGPLTYTWQFKPVGGSSFTPLANGGRISGANTATLMVTGALTSDSGTYRCLVSNSSGTANSGPATLTVTP